MTPGTGTAILVLGVFVLPGFVTALLRERLFVIRREESAFDRLLLALFYSALVYAIVFVIALIAGADRGDVVSAYKGRASLSASLGLALAAVLVLPLCIAGAGARWQRSTKLRPRTIAKLGLSTAHGTRSGWDAMFSKDGTAMIRVRLKDGGVVGGWYGPDSLAAYAEHGHDVFVAERWALDDDGWFSQPAPGSLGVWVAGDEIAAVELYEAVPPDPPKTPEGLADSTP